MELLGALRQLDAARALDVQVHTLTVFDWGNAKKTVSTKSSRRYSPSFLSDAPGLRLAVRWLRSPRASRPDVLYGIGPSGAEAAVQVARALGCGSVVWSGSIAGQVEPSVLRRADDVWALDDHAVNEAVRHGIRAFRASLTPSSSAIAPAQPPVANQRLCVLMGHKPPPPGVVRGIVKGGRGLELIVLGEASLVPEEWRSLGVRVISTRNQGLRRSALEWCSGVLVGDVSTTYAYIVEALLLGRPLVVSRNQMPRCFCPSLGFSYDATNAESVADALFELWSAHERSRFCWDHIRVAGEQEALETRISTWVDRTLSLVKA